MTRLTVKDIEDISNRLTDYDQQLQKQTGRTLLGIACHACELEESILPTKIKSAPVAIVPITTGQGIITGFSQTLESIAKHLGFRSFITKAGDIAGIVEAVEKSAIIILMADDERFIALNILTRSVIDNDDATAMGFVAGLDLMSGGVAGRDVLVAGCGPVGRKSALEALKRGAHVALLDINPMCSREALKELERAISYKTRITIEGKFEEAVKRSQLIIDATDAWDLFSLPQVKKETYIAAPGIPLGLTEKAVEKIANRLYHDPLQTGVAVMLIRALFPLEEGNEY